MSDRALFITWDGPQVSYLTGLFLPVFAGLKELGHEVSVLQFTWGKDNGEVSAFKTAGLHYRRVDVSRRGGSIGAFTTAVRGGADVDAAVADWKVDFLFPRSLMPSLAVFRSQSRHRLPILFDADGLPADERVEFGGDYRWGPNYTILRMIERRMSRQADHILVRTEAAVRILADRAGIEGGKERFTIVPNPRSAAISTAQRALSEKGHPNLVYVGSLGPQYRPVEMLHLVAAIRARMPATRFDIFTSDKESATRLLEEAGLSHARWIRVETLAPEELANRLPNYDAGLALRTPSLSMQAVSPIKIGDYLIAGLPVIGSVEVGEVSYLLTKHIMVGATGADDAEIVTEWLECHVYPRRDELRNEARQFGSQKYSLSHAVCLYAQAFQETLARKD